MSDFPFTSRTEAMKVACPRCEAKVGEKCVGVRGKVRERIHRERMNVAAANMGLPPVQGFSLRGDRVIAEDGTVVGRLVSVEIEYQRLGAEEGAGEPTERKRLELGLNEDALLKSSLSDDRSPEENQASLLPDPVDETWELYAALLEKPRMVLTPQRRKMIANAHKATSVELTQQAIRGLAASEYHRENNYTGIEYAIVPKRGQSIETRIEFMAGKAPAPGATGNGVMTVDQLVEQFAPEYRQRVMDEILKPIVRSLTEKHNHEAVDEGNRQLRRLESYGYKLVIEGERVVGARRK